MLSPKLLGTYETEISHLFTREYLDQFDQIADIGCAEGYYAVGCALIAKNAVVKAFDISCSAREICAAMAEFNGVADRVSIEAECCERDLRDLAGKRCLVISDCEGFENELFPEKLITELALSDFIIEVHDLFGVDPGEFEERFSATHVTTKFRSLTDFEKAITYSSDLLDAEPLVFRPLLIAECRVRRMSWLFAQSRQIIGQDGAGGIASGRA